MNISEALSQLRHDQKDAFDRWKTYLYDSTQVCRKDMINTTAHIMGKTGAGKSFLLVRGIVALIERGQSVIIHCPSKAVLDELYADTIKFVSQLDDDDKYHVVHSDLHKVGASHTWFTSLTHKVKSNKKLIIFTSTQTLYQACKRMGMKKANEFFRDHLKVRFVFTDEAHRLGIVYSMQDRGYDFGITGFDVGRWLKMMLEAFNNIPKFATTATQTNSQLNGDVRFSIDGKKYIFRNTILSELIVREENQLPFLMTATYGPYLSPSNALLNTQSWCPESGKIEKAQDVDTWKKASLIGMLNQLDDMNRVMKNMKKECPEMLEAVFGHIDDVPNVKSIVFFSNREGADVISEFESICVERGYNVAMEMPDTAGINRKELDYFKEPISDKNILFVKMQANEGINVPSICLAAFCRTSAVKGEVSGAVIQCIGRIVRTFFPKNVDVLEKVLERKLTRAERYYHAYFSSPTVHAPNSYTLNKGMEAQVNSNTFNMNNIECLRFANPDVYSSHILEERDFHRTLIDRREELLVEYLSKMENKKQYVREDMRNAVLAKMNSCPITGAKDSTVLDVAHLVPHADIVNDNLNFDETQLSLYCVLRTDLHRRFDALQFYFEPVSHNSVRLVHNKNNHSSIKEELSNAGATDRLVIFFPWDVNTDALEYRKNLVIRG